MNFLRIRQASRPLYSLMAIAFIGLIAILLVSACGSTPPRPRSATPTLTLTPTFPPTLTPTPLPLGTGGHPFVIGLVSENQDPQTEAAADELARRIAGIARVNVIGRVYPSYKQLLESMARGEVHATWMPPLTYLYASQMGLAEVSLLTNHFGVYAYGVQFLANTSSELTPFYDPISGQSSADAATALGQLKGLRPCWVEPQSPSGYILPAGLLRLNEIDTQPAVITQTHTAVVRALYIKGVCDFGATFAISGDPRTASAVQEDLPDVMDRIFIVWRSDASIPNLSLALLAGLSEADRQTLTNAFLELSQTAEGRAYLTLSAGNYQIEEMRPVNDDAYKTLRDVSNALELNLSEMLGK